MARTNVKAQHSKYSPGERLGWINFIYNGGKNYETDDWITDDGGVDGHCDDDDDGADGDDGVDGDDDGGDDAGMIEVMRILKW